MKSDTFVSIYVDFYWLPPDIERVKNNTPFTQKKTTGKGRTVGNRSKIVNLTYYRIKKNLQAEGFDLIADNSGNLKLVLRRR